MYHFEELINFANESKTWLLLSGLTPFNGTKYTHAFNPGPWATQQAILVLLVLSRFRRHYDTFARFVAK